MIDINTFGKSPAAIVLAKIINEKGLYGKRISKLLNNFNRTIHELEKVDSRIGLGLAKLSYGLHKENCDKLPLPFNTYVANVLHTNYSQWIVKQKGNIAYKNRKNV